jgi:alpha-beta hydrolase superfamily lysophospholipase
MRALAEHLHGLGFYVLVLRLPGHGTVPAALRSVTWEDWDAATTLAARHVATRIGADKPFYAAGYSTGAPLVLLHTLRALAGSGERAPDRLVLMSPAIGLAPFAALTNFAAALSFVPYFEKANWLDVLPEYDPFKYNSFPVNAANQIWRLTRVLEDALAEAHAAGRLERFPPVLAFQSLVDATVSTADVFSRLFMRLPPRGHELVVFGVNTAEGWDALVAQGPIRAYEELSQAPALPFRLAVVANRADRSASVVEYWREPLGRKTGSTDLPERWPAGVLSLGHIALPFPIDDPLYGLEPKDGGLMGYAIGAVATRGESGAMAVPLGSLARIHSNPFFDLVRGRVSAAVEADRARR